MRKERKGRDTFVLNQEKVELDKKIDQLMKRLMPQLPQRLKQFTRKIEYFDVRKPATLKAEVERSFTAFANSLNLQDMNFFQDMMRLVGTSVFKHQVVQFIHAAVRMAKDKARGDNRYSLLLRLVDEAHGRVPYMPWYLLKDHADPNFMFELQFAPADLMAEAERTSGEVRATAVLRLLKEVAEPLYKLYINRIWVLSYIKEGAWPSVKKIPSFGNLVSETNNRLREYPGLVDVDAAWMRNSVSHNRRIYLPSEDAVELWDEKRPKEKVPVGELLKKVKAMHEIAAFTFPLVAQIYLFRTVFLKSGILEVVVEQIPSVSSLDESRIKQADQAMETKIKTLFAPVEAFAKLHIKA
jgi:hypothetical protein